MALPFKDDTMRRTWILIILALAVIALMGFFAFRLSPNTEEKTVQTPHALTRMAAIGPVGKGVTYQEQIGRHSFVLKAERINFKKTKTLGFENNLVKKMVATGVTITIIQGDQTRLMVSKDRIEMAPNMKNITINHPTVLAPATLPRPDRIKIDKASQTVILYHGKDKEVWRLN